MTRQEFVCAVGGTAIPLAPEVAETAPVCGEVVVKCMSNE